MRIDSSLPMHIARAYGLKAVQSASAPNGPEAAQPVSPVRAVDAYEPSRPSAIDQLVAGKVAQAVDFDTSTVARPGSAETLQLYTRAADRIEAAVAVQMGRSLDVRG